MPLPIIAGTVRASFRGVMPSGRQWANVHHWRFTGGASTPGTSDITALDAIITRLYTGTSFTGGAAWLAACRSTVTLIDATYYKLDGTSTPIVITHSATGIAGTGNQLPAEVAHVLTVRTARRGRSYRGRIYFPAVTTSFTDVNGNILATLVNNTLAQWDGAVTALGGAGTTPFWEPGIASYLHATFEPSGQGAAFRSMDVKPDVQRRRK